MAKGYAEGPAAEEAERRREELERGLEEPEAEPRLAVYGSTEDDPERHFIGWRDEVDPDGLRLRRGLGPDRRARHRTVTRTALAQTGDRAGVRRHRSRLQALRSAPAPVLYLSGEWPSRSSSSSR